MIATSTRDPNATEANARMAWTLRETGTFPTRDQLRAIREYREQLATKHGDAA